MEKILLKCFIKKKFDKDEVYSEKRVRSLVTEFIDEYRLGIEVHGFLGQLLEENVLYKANTPVGEFYIVNTNYLDSYESLEEELLISYLRARENLKKIVENYESVTKLMEKIIDKLKG